MKSKACADGTFVPVPYLSTRLDALRKAQNPDGGWGYFAGKESWLEPTAYAAMALHGEPASDRAWQRISSWQMQDGSWKSSAKVGISSWATSLCVNLAIVRGEWGAPTQKGVQWLLGSTGTDLSIFGRILVALGLTTPERNAGMKGWPWKPGTSSWVEPTAHALVTLRKVLASDHLKTIPRSAIAQRIQAGEKRLFELRSRDGGWNYGSPDVFDIDLPSYPETTALALVGLQGHPGLEKAFELTAKMMQATPSPLGRAWLTIAMRLHGMAAPESSGPLSTDVMITAVEALSASAGNWKLMQVGAGAIS